MWKQTVGDWQERRHHRSGPAPTTPQSTLPESVASTEHSARGFLPRGFHDHAPRTACPAPDGVETRPTAPLQDERQTVAHALTETWVTVTGASPDDVLDVRDFLDANVGRTVSHCLPPLARVLSDVVYIQFASSIQAAQAVRTGTYATQVESGVAAVGIKPTIDTGAAPIRPHYYHLEMVLSWCTDQMFLEEREKLRRQLLTSAAPSPPRTAAATHAGGPHGSAGRTPSLESSARGSEPHAAADTVRHSSIHRGTDDDDADSGGAAAHPLLPRRRPGVVGGSQPPPSMRTSSTSPSPSASGNGNGDPQVRDAEAYYRSGGAYRYEDSFFSDGLHSAGRETGRRSTVLSLFFHPYSSSYGLLYSLCLYTPLRFVLLVLWTLRNAVGQFLSASTFASAKPAPPSQTRAPAPTLPPLSRWRRRRTLSVSDVVPTCASPVEYAVFLLYKYIPFIPEPVEVDVVLWSWLALRNPYPQRSLRLLRQSLLVRQRNTDAMEGQQRLGGTGDGTDNTDVGRYARFGSVDVLGAEPYNNWERQQHAERYRELSVLLRWRPAWWFSQYSSLSLLALVVLVCCHFWHSRK